MPPAEKSAEKPESAAETYDLTVDEFCAQASATDNRVELLAAFHASEVRAGRVKDGAAAFADRYSAFANAPA